MKKESIKAWGLIPKEGCNSIKNMDVFESRENAREYKSEFNGFSDYKNYKIVRIEIKIMN